jgi:hypothetical protein
MSLGGAPATATIALQLAAPSRLDVRLNASTLDLDGWARLLNGTFAGFDPPSIPMRLDLAADGATLLGGVLGGISGVLLLEGGHATLDNVTAHLPGDAKLDFSGKIARGEHALLTVEGPATLDAPDLHATLAWLRPLAPPLLDAVPHGVLRSARLAGTARLTPGAFSAQGLTGSMDGVPMSGGFDLAFGGRPNFAATLSLDHLFLDDWLGGHGWGRGMALAEAAKSFTGVETALHLRAGSASWNGQDLHDVAVDAATGAAGLKIDHAAAGFANATLDFAGVLGPDGTLADVHGHIVTKDAAALLAKLPPDWRWAPGLWQGEADLAFSADGPPDAVSLQLRASADDLVTEAESVRDTVSGAAQTTLTLRHPGAPRLLASLGVPGAEHFLETGSFALLAHLHSLPGHVQVQDFSLDAASMHLGGHGDLDLSGTEPGFDFDVQSASLALPDLATLRSVKLPASKFHGQMRLSAQDVAVGGALVAHDLEASLTSEAGLVLADKLTARLAGGVFAGQWALDATLEQPAMALRGELTGLDLAGIFPSMPVSLDTGKADLSLDVASAGQTGSAILAHLSGDMGFTLHDAHMVGFDLNRVDTLLATRGRSTRPALMQALTQGSSGGFSGSGTISMASGKLAVSDMNVSSGDGVVSATGTVAMPAGAIDLLVRLTPAVSSPPHYALKLTGTAHDLKVQPDLGKPLAARAVHPVKRPSKT